MSRVVLRRCKHCGTTYGLHRSGSGCGSELNDPDYCAECKRVVLDALSSVPKRFSCQWIETHDVPAETVVGWCEEGVAARQARRAAGDLVPERVHVGLIDQVDPSNKHVGGWVKGRGPYEGRSFRFTYWSKVVPEDNVRTPEGWVRPVGGNEARPGGIASAEVWEQVEVEVATGRVVGPWVSHRQ